MTVVSAPRQTGPPSWIISWLKATAIFKYTVWWLYAGCMMLLKVSSPHRPAVVDNLVVEDHRRALLWRPLHLGFGRIVVSEIEAPNMIAIPVLSGCVAVQSDNATEP